MKESRFLFRFLFPAALVFSACTCSSEAAIQQVLGNSAEAPVFLDCRAVSSDEVVFRFSLPVKVVSLVFDPPGEAGILDAGEEVKVKLYRPFNGGEKITADILVEDEHRNTLNVLVPFRTRNDRIPDLLINELRTEYTKPKAEYVELRAMSAGNLGALRLFAAGHSLTSPLYEFPPIEVKAGEYIVLHLRTLEEGWADETGDELDLSKAADSCPTARDLWISESTKYLHKTDAVFLLDQDDAVIDAVVLNEDTDWQKKAFMNSAAQLLGSKGAWLPLEENSGKLPGPGDAVASNKSATTRTVSRDETIPDSNRSGDWYITASSNATPGFKNSTKRF
ncbi:MAG: hypothetical protein LBC62_01310 [Treponema sp.]|jgi:hypothetical protein|nr:hypothetical protein [Treponema sp.]